MIHLNVWLTFPDGALIRCGELLASKPDAGHGGALGGEFRYTAEFLRDPRAFALDPVVLPLESRVFAADRPRAGVHAVFEDSLPDDWGRRLMVRSYRLPRARQRVPDLLVCLGANGLGALRYSERQTPDPPAPTAGRVDLPALIQAAQRFETGETGEDDELALLFQAGSSPGGARPKVLLHDHGVNWLAKLPSIRDHLDLVRIEAATLALARSAGVDTPDFRVVEAGDRPVLLVRRFDVTEAGGRYHLISFQSLLNAADAYYYLRYADLAGVIRLHGARPDLDLPRLYRLMVFNAAVGNTDDHLKNFTMLHGDEGWRLAPAYDLLPNIAGNTEHVLRFTDSSHMPGRGGLLRLAGEFGISPRAAREAIEAVWGAMAEWQDVYRDFGVSEADRQTVAEDIARRRDKGNGDL